ncbi:HAD-like domain-containing protein [Mycena crocata]|nr:HAD-like domain-containing protein [Mycena crocata]
MRNRPFLSKTELPRPPSFDVDGINVLYFDAHGTLIDNESGIFAALQPLLARCTRTFDRQEALGFYFESETEEKKRTPAAPYLDILAAAYNDMSARLGLRCADDETSSFVSSMFTWPLFDGALECVQRLHPRIPTLVALLDVDYATLLRTSAFQALEPCFDEMFTWDASKTYRPDPSAFSPPFAYHDGEGIDPAHRCLVSNSVFRDLEPARLQLIPAIWLRLPSTLAGGCESIEHSVPWRVCSDFEALSNIFLRTDVIAAAG